MKMNAILVLMLLTSLSSVVLAGLKSCCPLTLSTECRESCMKLVPPSVFDYKNYFNFPYLNEGLAETVEKCPRSEELFWDCLHDTELWKDFRLTKSRDKKRRTKHSGCCKQAKHISCEVECHTTTRISNLLQNENCNAVREPKLTQCIMKVHDAKKCCNSKNKGCKHACMQYFKNGRPENVMMKKLQLEKKCGKKSRQFKCAIDQSQFHTAFQDFTACCNKDDNSQCINSCKNALKNSKDFTNFFDKLGKHCGAFDFDKPIYQCFVQNAAKRTKPADNTIGSAHRTGGVTTVYPPFRKQCCNRAKSPECRSWCEGTISRPNLMGLWDNMYLSCIQNPKEVELSNCMSDILEPCEIGVKEPMSFCTNFNDRPLELFRRGDQYGDSAARKLHKFWNDSRIEILEYELLFKNVYECKPDMFKAMACLLAVKPCDHRSSQRQVCRSDCEELLESCLDKEASGTFSVERICATILPNSNQTNCISVKDYTERDQNYGLMRREDVTLPCEKNPCAEGEMCMINQDCNANSVIPCKRYKCVRGCPAVGKSKLIIPEEQLAKLSKAGNNDKECYQVCKCHSTSSHIVDFGKCKEFGCNRRKNCTLPHTTYVDGEIFENECNTCTCVDGSLVCTEKYCEQHNGRPKRHHSTSLATSGSPCKCHNAYKPVCATNGMTYPNSCLAKCKNIKDNHLSLGDCLSIDPCNPDPCEHGLQCVPTRNVCLSPWRHCPQYTCVSSAVSSPTYFSDSFRLCGSDENDISEVCGYDGIIYPSKCLAEYTGTGIDYEGACVPSEDKNTGGNIDRCKIVECPHIDSSICNPVTPPGSCCAVCGTFIRLSHGEKQIAVRDSVKEMRQLLKVVECKLYAHLTADNDLLVILTVGSSKPTRALADACVTEAGRIRECYGSRSPMESEVCGYDSVTYRCKCQAEDAGTGVDYEGPCMPSKYKSAEGNIDRCAMAECPNIDNSICNLVTPPGSCCPVCGSMIRALYSKQDLRRHQNFIDYKPITVRDIVNYMRKLLKVAECKLYGHLTVENELLIIVTVNSLKPTRGQVHACKTEAERFNKYINNRSPVVTTSYFLSLLKASKLQTASYKSVRSSARVQFERTKSYTLISLFTLFSLIYLNLIR